MEHRKRIMEEKGMEKMDESKSRKKIMPASRIDHASLSSIGTKMK